MTDPKRIADTYLAVWNEPDNTRRRTLVAENWTSDSTYVDPMMTGSGHEGIALMIDAARTQFPGHDFTLAGTPDGYGNRVRFSWTLAAGNSPAVAGGTDIVRLDDEGRIAEVVGFLDGAPA